jgi:hypothetical protein
MRITKICVLFLVTLALLGVIPVWGGNDRNRNNDRDEATQETQFIAWDIWDPDFGIPGSSPILPGGVFVGGFSFNNEGVFTIEAPFYSDDPRLVGNQAFTVNSNLDANGEGPYWGDWSIDAGNYGVWEGSYSGHFYLVDGSIHRGIEHGELYGRGGTIHGLVAKMDGIVYSYYGGFAFTAGHTGYIQKVHGRR